MSHKNETLIKTIYMLLPAAEHHHLLFFLLAVYFKT